MTTFRSSSIHVACFHVFQSKHPISKTPGLEIFKRRLSFIFKIDGDIAKFEQILIYLMNLYYLNIYVRQIYLREK